MIMSCSKRFVRFGFRLAQPAICTVGTTLSSMKQMDDIFCRFVACMVSTKNQLGT
jgi:hypothetical protein